MGEIRDACGLAAISLKPGKRRFPVGKAANYLIKMLLQEQHRGQQGAGITTYNAERKPFLRTRRGLGRVHEAFKLGHRAKMLSILDKYSGTSGIGHTRYATIGVENLDNVQPFERTHGRTWKCFSVALNGNLANYNTLVKQLEKSHYSVIRGVDTEVIMHFLAKQFLGSKRTSLVDAFSSVSKIFDGAYNLVYLNAEGSVVAARDPLGLRPLCYSKDDNFVEAASESCALFTAEKNHFKDIPPGKMLVMDRNGNASLKRFAKSKRKAYCMFEWVYISNPVSVLDGRSVYSARWNLGHELSKIETESVNRDEYIVVPVPDTAIPAAHGLADSLGLRVEEGLLRNRYVGRTFIEGADRVERAKEKYALNKSVLRGKKVMLVEDSIVRGTTTRVLVNRIKKQGRAKEVHVRISCPPIKGVCFYGVDMPTLAELIAPNHMRLREVMDIDGSKLSGRSLEGITREIGADSVIYQTIPGLIRAIKLPDGKRSLCMACLNGKYPTHAGRKNFCLQQKKFKKRAKRKHIKRRKRH